MTNTLSIVVNNFLPALSGSPVIYDPQSGTFLTQGYTSNAGNTYYQNICLSDRIIIKLNLGEGYYFTFLNGIEIFGFNGKKTKLIGSRSYNSYVFSEKHAKQEAKDIIVNYLKGQTKLIGTNIDNNQLDSFALYLVEDAYKQTQKLIAQ